MEIMKHPIVLRQGQSPAMELFYAEFGAAMKSIHRGRDPERHARDCVSLCRAALAGFCCREEFTSVQQVINHFNCHLQDIIKAGNFKSTSEFDILTYGPGQESEQEIERERLNREVLPMLCPKEEEVRFCKPKPAKAALFQGIENSRDFFHESYGK
jgi:hypothetical protein